MTFFLQCHCCPTRHPTQLLLQRGLVPTGDEARDVLISMARAPCRDGWQTAWQVLTHTHSAQQLAQLTSVEPFYLLPRGMPPAQPALKRRVVEVRDLLLVTALHRQRVVVGVTAAKSHSPLCPPPRYATRNCKHVQITSQILMQSVVQMLSSFLYNLAPESSLGRRPAYLVRCAKNCTTAFAKNCIHMLWKPQTCTTTMHTPNHFTTTLYCSHTCAPLHHASLSSPWPPTPSPPTTCPLPGWLPSCSCGSRPFQCSR